jgi:hypothetical protein
MESWAEIRRRVLADGLSGRAACREYKIHWKTLKKILDNTEPPGYRRTKPRVYASAWDVWRLSEGTARFTYPVRLAGDRIPLVLSGARITRPLQGRPHHGLRPRLVLHLPAP